MEIPKPDELEMKSWGSRADFFARLPSCSRPDVDWRSALTPRVRQAIPAWSQGFEDLVLRDFFQEKTGGVFLDIGCAWPQNAALLVMWSVFLSGQVSLWMPWQNMKKIGSSSDQIPNL